MRPEPLWQAVLQLLEGLARRPDGPDERRLWPGGGAEAVLQAGGTAIAEAGAQSAAGAGIRDAERVRGLLGFLS